MLPICGTSSDTRSLWAGARAPGTLSLGALTVGAAVACGATAATHPVPRILATLGLRGSGWDAWSVGDRRGVWVHALHAEPREWGTDLVNGSRHCAAARDEPERKSMDEEEILQEIRCGVERGRRMEEEGGSEGKRESARGWVWMKRRRERKRERVWDRERETDCECERGWEREREMGRARQRKSFSSATCPNACCVEEIGRDWYIFNTVTLRCPPPDLLNGSVLLYLADSVSFAQCAWDVLQRRGQWALSCTGQKKVAEERDSARARLRESASGASSASSPRVCPISLNCG